LSEVIHYNLQALQEELEEQQEKVSSLQNMVVVVDETASDTG
jgi:Arc/MetJ-type ribon-helix-helix transcriptional regulator